MCGAVIRRPASQRYHVPPSAAAGAWAQRVQEPARTGAGSCSSSSIWPEAEGDLEDAVKRMGVEKVECGHCKVLNAIECGFEGFVCGGCGQTNMVHLSAASARFRKRAEQQVAVAKSRVTTLLVEQAASCRRLWDSVQEELAVEEALWTSQDQPVLPGAAHTWAVAREGFAQGNFDRVTAAVADLERQGVLKSSAAFSDSLQKLHHAEELLTAWRCVEQALNDEDRSSLEFWEQEVLSQGGESLADIKLAVAALEAAEKSQLAQWEFQKDWSERVDSALQACNERELLRLIDEAKLRGISEESAQKALVSLQADRATGTTAELNALSLLRCKSVADLRADLRQAGVKHDTIFDKEEMVQLLYVTRLQNAPGERGSVQSEYRAPLRVESVPSGPVTAAAAEAPSSPFSRDPAVVEGARFFAHRSAAAHAEHSSSPSCRNQAGRPVDSSLFGAHRHPATAADDPTQRHASTQASTSSGQRPGAKPGGARTLLASADKMTRGKALLCLGLDDTASAVEIRSAYKKAALRWHPDRRQNHDNEEDAKARFQEAKEAFDYLSKWTPP